MAPNTDLNLLLDDEELEDEVQTDPPLQLQVTAADEGQRLDVYVTAHLPESTRAEAQRLIGIGADMPAGVHVNGKREKPNYRLRPNDTVSVQRPVPTPSRLVAEAIPIPIVFEDEDLLVVDKPRGMVVHPAPGSLHGTLVHAILAHADDLSGIGGEERPGIVHRLDKDTGGLLMIAKNDFAHRALQEQIQSRTAERRYLALVWGIPQFTHATIEAPVGRHMTDRKKMAVVTDPHRTARPALTDLTVLETFEGIFTLLEAKLQTGRTHQIRVHCAYINHPVVGDPTYGGIRKLPGHGFTPGRRAALENGMNNLNGQALHAYSLRFYHPRTAEILTFTVPLPPPFQELLDSLRSVS